MRLCTGPRCQTPLCAKRPPRIVKVRCEMGRNQLGVATRLLHPERESEDPFRAVVPPLYQTATFDQPSATEMGIYDYTRSGNPTRSILEQQITDLEGGVNSFAFSSGMAALSVVCKLIKSGETILAGDDLYGGSSRLLAQVVPTFGIRVTHVDTTDLKSMHSCGTCDGKVCLARWRNV